MHTKDYRAVFEGIESTLISIGSHSLPAQTIRERLDSFKQLEGRAFSDAEYYW
jgi:hypothetical protein